MSQVEQTLEVNFGDIETLKNKKQLQHCTSAIANRT